MAKSLKPNNKGRTRSIQKVFKPKAKPSVVSYYIHRITESETRKQRSQTLVCNLVDFGI